MKCPKCRSEMIGRIQTGVALWQCAGCDGMWADQGDLATMMGTETDLRATFTAECQTSYSCPRGCGTKLDEVHYSRLQSDLLLDRCPACGGVYLDAGELRRVWRLNERIRDLFGEGTFAPGAKGGRGRRLGRLFQKLFGE